LADQNQEPPPTDGHNTQEDQIRARSPSEEELFADVERWLVRGLIPGGDPIPIARAPSTITVIDGTDVRRSGARYVSDVLRMVPGLEVLRTTSTESNVAARGYNDSASTAQGMMGLIDGRQVYNDFFGNVLWDALPVSLDEIDRIEVIRGPGSFLYGPNAMHGLVNIVTKSPLDYGNDDLLHLSAGGGNYRSSLATMMYVKQIPEDNAGFKTTLEWNNISRFEPRDKGSSDKVFVNLGYEKQFGEDEDNHRIELAAGATTMNQELIIASTGAIPSANLANDTQDLFVQAKYTLGDLKAQAVWAGFDATSNPNRIYQPFEVDLDTVDIDLQYSFGGDESSAWKDHNVTVGAGYSYSTFTTHDTDLVWGFVQDEITLGDVYVTAGLRVDWYSTSGLNLSPRVAAAWEFTTDQYLRASAGFGFRNPSLRENFFNMPLSGVPVTIVGNDDLDAEKMRSFELGWFGSFDFEAEAQQGAIEDPPDTPVPSLKAGVNVFYNLIDDLIVFQPTAADPSKVGPINREDDEAYGVEIEAEYLFTKWTSAFANYSYEIRQDRDTSHRIATAPRHKANAGLRMSTEWGLSAMLWLNYFDETAFGGVPSTSEPSTRWIGTGSIPTGRPMTQW
jgi:iron complex outermembrane receptor protein